MKKNILLIISLLFAFFLNAAVSKTVTVTTAGTLRTLLTPTEMTTVTDLTVSGSIDARDFKFIRDGITNLAILDIGVVNVEAYSGTGGTSTSISYPANELPADAFSSADAFTSTHFTSLIIPNSVTSIGNKAFYCCSRLTSITIPNSVKSIGYWAFFRCSGLTSISIPNSVTSISSNSFYICSGLTSLSIPNSVTSIGEGAFSGCSGLTSLTIGNSVKSIGINAFYGCSRLTSLNIPNSVTSIGYQAFSGCGGLTILTIGNSVASIGDFILRGCTGLTSIFIYITSPIVISSSVFATVNVYACTLYVPASTKSAYQATPIWGDFNIVEMSPTALPTLTSKSVNIYPNPVIDGFQINRLEGTGILTFTDLSGKILLTKQVKTNDYISVSYLPKGVYIVKITTAYGTIERKVIKK